jgi:carbon monoxide dehydrogenase subunit G
MEIMASREVAASAGSVWEIVTDLDGSPAVLTAVERVERLDEGDGFGLGTRWRETRTMLGRQATEEMEVTAVDPPRSYTVVAVDGSTTYTSTITVDPLVSERCVLRMSFTGTSSGLAARILAATVGRLFAGATRRALQQDVDDIASHAESGTAS